MAQGVKPGVAEKRCKPSGIVLIQKAYRGVLGRKRFHRVKRDKANVAYQTNFSDEEHLTEYKFKASGAALQIQTWFRNLPCRRKRKWQRLYCKFIAKLKREKILRRGIRKSKGYLYTRNDLADPDKRLVAIVVVICRVIRGFMGRRRFTRLKKAADDLHVLRTSNAILIQKILRRTSVRTKFPLIGQRFRMLQGKRQRWERRNTEMQRLSNHQHHQDHEYQQHPRLSGHALESRSSSSSSLQSSPEDELGNIRHLPEHSEFLRRRPSFLFLHLKLGDVQFLQSLHQPATLIQCLIRCYLAKHKIVRKRKNKRFGRIAQLKSWLVKIVKKRRVLKSLRVIQPVWRRQAQLCFRKRACSIKIQSAWRTHITRRNFKLLLKLRYFSSCKIIRWAQRRLARRAVCAQLQRTRQLAELRQAGISCYTATHARWVAHHMWQGIKVRNYTSQHELQKVFQANSVNGGLEGSKMAKIAKECKDLVSESLTLNQIEIQFTKIKNPLEKRIDYLKFVDLLCNLAVIKFMGVDPSRIAGAPEDVSGAASSAPSAPSVPSGLQEKDASSATAAGDVETGGEDRDKEKEKEKIPIASFVYAGLRGRPALVTRFVIEILSSVVDYRRSAEFLDSKRTSASALTRMLIKDNVLMLQRFMRNRSAVRRITAELAAHKARKVALRRNNAARAMQGLVRGFLGRRQIKRMAQAMYTKFIDGATEREYWCNPRTNVSHWTKPALLGEFDCGMATRMPSEEERYSVVCAQCTSTTATCFCIQCDEPYCTMCYALGHRAGHRKNHAHLLVDNCVQCEFQVGTRYCISCKDTYCDSCYKHMHKRGRLRFHLMERHCEACEVCGDLSAQWDETVEATAANSYKQHKLWCARCYKEENGVLPQDVPLQNPPVLTRVAFYGQGVKLHRETVDKEKRAVDVASAFEARKKELERLRQDKAVCFIQRVYRGHRKRRAIADFLAERREFMRLRREEESERNKIIYKLTSMLGVAKALKSDTPLERVMKLYPSYMHHILGISVNNNWAYACKLLTEHEERLKHAPRTNIFQRSLAHLSVSRRKGRFEQTEKNLSDAAAVYDTATLIYQNAQASGAMTPSKLESLKSAIALSEARYHKVNEKKMAAEASLQEAQTRLEDCIGPRGIQRLVAQRRREGVLLPFRITLKRHSRLALVSYWEGDHEKSEEEQAVSPSRAPGKWKEHLKSQDFIRIEGGVFRVAPAMGAATRKKSARPPSSAVSIGSEGDDSALGAGVSQKSMAASQKSVGGDESEGGSGVSRKRRRKLGRSTKTDGGDSDSAATSVKKKSTSSRPASAGSDTGSDYSDKDKSGLSTAKSAMDRFNLEMEVREETTEDHITLDHPWMLADAYDVPVYKVLPRVFYYKPLFFARRLATQSYPVQKVVALSAITLHKYAALLTWLQANFEEDSDTHASFTKRIQRTREGRDKWLQLSRTIVQMQYDFTLRRQASNLLLRMFGASVAFVKLIRGLMKTAGGTSESPFEYWQRSLEKVDVICIIDKGNDHTTVLGEFKLDLKAPAEIMREFIRRSFRTELNTTIGDSFLFFKVDPDTAVEEILLRENEFKTYSHSYCFEKTDAKTMVTTMAILIIPDPNRGRVVIPEFAAEGEDEKANAEMENLL